MADLVVVVPSRGRPDNARRLAQAFALTCKTRPRLFFAIDDDDPSVGDYPDAVKAYARAWPYKCGPWQPMVTKLNGMVYPYAETDDAPFVLGFMGDDHLPITPGWDTKVLAALREMGTGVVYGDDGFRHADLASSWFMTADIVRALGRMVPAPVEHLACDNAVMDLAREAGCLRYLPDVLIEHRHPLAGKSEWDSSYARTNSAAQYHKDLTTYAEWRLRPDGMAADVAKVAALVDRAGFEPATLRVGETGR